MTGTGSLSLTMGIVNTAWLMDLRSGVTVSATAIANWFRLYLPMMRRKGWHLWYNGPVRQIHNRHATSLGG